MSGPHCLHLLPADAGLVEEPRYGKYLAVCGELLEASELPSALCSGDCKSEITYCPACVRVAAGFNAEIESWSVGVR